MLGVVLGTLGGAGGAALPTGNDDHLNRAMVWLANHFEEIPNSGPYTWYGIERISTAGGFRYVAARGELTTRRFPETGTANGAFRFADGSVEEAWARWAATGVNHHSSATPGDLSAPIESVARLLGVEAVIV